MHKINIQQDILQVTIALQRGKKAMFFLIISILTSLSFPVSAQDIIRLDFQDSILADVTSISDKYVTYKLNPYFEGALDSIKLRKVTDILYANGELKTYRKDFWDKTYSPGVYMLFGSEDINNGILIGLGHTGNFRITKTGIALVYSMETGYWRSSGTHSSDAPDNSYSDIRPYYYTINMKAGVEYRYSFSEFFGVFVNGLAGKAWLKYFPEESVYTSSPLMYSVSLGVYIRRWKIAAGYAWGGMAQKSSGGTDYPYIQFDDENKMLFLSGTFYF